ncbi:hypothetical protein J8I87_29015 [Paraburkholderia sp. LEh10]|uniref:hypothetical protein n=1 Tax=Paraburkholderia sp. LEh10 TaxID=2821353 RepID=UPI001AEAA346|nr:hypothetical protein [Paraburkholderia sp. LEh10]MBP0593659.1 hypothetical protein [Paraburkholderia sp. LEh10]
MTNHLDDERWTDLLCHLVVAQLIARARTGDWLRTDHLVESKRIWSQANGVSPGWLEGVRLSRASMQLAASIWAIDLLRNPDEISKLFSKNWRLDQQSPIVRGIYDVCAARLSTWWYES